MPDSSKTSATLIQRIRDPQDTAAWSQFMEIYQPMIRAYRRRCGLQDADAADTSQEIMRAVARNISRFDYDPQRARFRGWLFTIARNKVRDCLKDQRAAQRGSGSTTQHQMLAEVPDQQETEDWQADCQKRLFEWAAQQARGQFQEKTWRAFLLSAVEGKPASEVSAQTGLSERAVYTAKCRVLARLRELIANHVGDEWAE